MASCALASTYPNPASSEPGVQQKTSDTGKEQKGLKPILNWANVCSPNILRTLRRTMIRFLIELLVSRIRFGQSRLYFILNWFVMRCKLQPELVADTADSMIEMVG